MSLNKVVSIGYFEANSNEIENIKNKELASAIFMLTKYQLGHYLIDDSNTAKIESISLSTTFAFNNALVKDIVNSYKALEKSISIVYKSDYKDLLEDEIFLNDKKITIHECENGEIRLIEDESLKYVQDNIGDIVNFNDDKLTVKYLTMQNTLLKDKKRMSFNLGYGVQELQIKSKLFEDKKNIEVEIENQEGVPEKTILLKGTLSIRKKGIYCTESPDSPTEIDVSPRISFINEAFLNLTGIDKYSYLLLTNINEKFTYGYLNDSTKYISSETKRRRMIANNSEYTSEVKKGREVFEKMNEEISILKGMYQYSFDTNETKESLLKKIEDFKEENKKYLASVNYFIDASLDKKEMISDSLQKIENFTNKFPNLKDTKEVLEQFKSNSSDEMLNLYYFYQSKKSIETSIQIFKKIKEKEFSIANDNLTLDEINKILRDYIIRKRASIYDVKVDSYTLNLRDGKSELSENFQKVCQSNDNMKLIVDNLKKNRYYDFFEFDKDYIESELKNKGKMLEFSKALLELNLATHKKNGFKVRKLGNYGAKNFMVSGLYSDIAGLIVVDTRYGNEFKSVKHEETHRMDMNNINKIGRGSLIMKLTDYFKPRVDSDYYFIEEELIARAGEVSCLLMTGNYAEHKKSYDSGIIPNKEEFWKKVKNDFITAKDAVLMKDYEEYLENPEYIDFENILDEKSSEYNILKECLEYFKPFYSKEQTDVRKILASSIKRGNEEREIEGISTKNLSTDWVLNQTLVRELKKNIEAHNIGSGIVFEEINYDNKENKEIKNISEIISDFEKNQGDVEELLFHIEGRGFGEKQLEDVSIEAISNIYKSHTLVEALTSKAGFDNRISYELFLEAYKQEKYALALPFVKYMSNEDGDSIVKHYLSMERELDDAEYDIAKKISSLYSGYSHSKIMRYFSLLDREDFKQDKISFISKDIISSNYEDVREKKMEILQDISKKRDISKEDLLKIGIKNYDDFKNFIVGNTNNPIEYINISEKILISSEIEYSKTQLYTDVFFNDGLGIEKQALQNFEKINLTEQELYDFNNKAVESGVKRFMRNGILVEHFQLDGKTSTELLLALIKNMATSNNGDKNEALREFKNILTYSIEKMTYNDYYVINNEIKNKINEIAPNESINIKGYEFFTKKTITQTMDSHLVQKAVSYSDDLKNKETDYSKVYFAVKEADYDTLNSLVFEIESPFFAGAMIALSARYESNIYEKLTNKSGAVEYHINDWKEIVKDESDIKTAFNSYLEYKISNNHHRYNNGFTNFIHGIAMFSGEINEYDIDSNIDPKTKSKRKIVNYLDNNYDVPSLLRNINILKLDWKKLNGTSLKIKKEDSDEILSRVNKILNKLDFLTIETRKKLGSSARKIVEDNFMVENKKTLIKDLSLNKEKLEKYGIQEDKVEYMELIYTQNKIFLLDEVIRTLSFSNTSASEVEKLIQLSEKIKYHSIKGEYDKVLVGADLIDKMLQKPMLCNLDIGFEFENKNIIKRIEVFKENIEKMELEEIKENIDVKDDVSLKIAI